MTVRFTPMSGSPFASGARKTVSKSSQVPSAAATPWRGSLGNTDG